MNRREFVLAAASLAVSPRALLTSQAAPPFSLVTADLESHVAVVDLTTGRVVRRIRTAAFPRSVETVGARAVVAHSDRGLVTILGGSPLAVLHLVGGFGEPRYTAADPSGRYAYVTDARRGELAVVDVVRGRRVARLPVGDRARHVSLDRRANRLWIALGTKALEVAVVDVRAPTAPLLLGRFRPPFRAHDVGFAPDGRHAWVTSGDRGELALYDVRSQRIVARPSADWAPQHVTFSRDRAYVTSGWVGTLRVHRLDGRPLGTTEVADGSYNVQYSNGRLLTPSLGRGILTILSEQGRVLHATRVARSTHDACIV